MSGFSDSFHRPIDYLRISVTDRCNLRCIYCVPPEGIPLMQHSDILTYEEIVKVVQAAAELGINKIRLSGGEPLVRAKLSSLVEMISHIDGIDDISLTTNGILLASQAANLKEAGLRRVNISLDTLKRERFKHITGYDGLLKTLAGIEQAHKMNLDPVKINVVAMKGVNDDELLDFALLSKEEGWHVRFIERMPLMNRDVESGFISAREMMQQFSALGSLEPCLSQAGSGPAKYYHFPGAKGTLGFITPISEHFCFKCNRIRLTADGRLLPCLLSDCEVDLRQVIRKKGSSQKITNLIIKAIAGKPECHQVAQGHVSQKRLMSQIGG